MFFRAPKGRLDANDRLFKLTAATIQTGVAQLEHELVRQQP
jgi:hypothetical protein